MRPAQAAVGFHGPLVLWLGRLLDTSSAWGFIGFMEAGLVLRLELLSHCFIPIRELRSNVASSCRGSSFSIGLFVRRSTLGDLPGPAVVRC